MVLKIHCLLFFFISLFFALPIILWYKKCKTLHLDESNLLRALTHSKYLKNIWMSFKLEIIHIFTTEAQTKKNQH